MLKADNSSTLEAQSQKQFTSPIHINISKLEGSYITDGASSQNLRSAYAQELSDRGPDIPVARNNLKLSKPVKNCNGQSENSVVLNEAYCIIFINFDKKERPCHQGKRKYIFI